MIIVKVPAKKNVIMHPASMKMLKILNAADSSVIAHVPVLVALPALAKTVLR
jgi:hypothetical protein